MEQTRALGYTIAFFILTCMFVVLTYNSFSNGDVKLGAAMAALALFMAGAGIFSLREFLICRFAEREMKNKN